MKKKKLDNIKYCGIKGFIRPPYNVFFNASCKKHDEGYAKGGDDLRRFECDVKFYINMVRDIRKLDGYFKRLYYRMWAFIYYYSVRLLGRSRFKYKKEK